MDSILESSHRRRARRAYEWARLRRGLLWGLIPASAALCGLRVTESVAWCLPLGLIASAVTIAFVWRGESLGKAVKPGLMAGLVSLGIALLAQTCSAELGGGLLACVLPCGLAGACIGLFGSGAVSSSSREDAALGLGSVALVALPLALIGCVGLGIGGVAGWALGAVISSAPVLRRAHG